MIRTAGIAARFTRELHPSRLINMWLAANPTARLDKIQLQRFKGAFPDMVYVLLTVEVPEDFVAVPINLSGNPTDAASKKEKA